MSERLAQTAVPSIRFHHLGLWNDLRKEVEKKFGVLKPWELTVSERELLILNFSRENTNGDIVARKYFERCSSDNQKYIQKDLVYLNDLVGSTQEQFEQVLERRIRAFNRIIDVVSVNKDTPILLTTESDDFCFACAIGKHCERKPFEKIIRSDRDFAYMRVIRKLMKGDLREYAVKGKIKELGKDKMSIQGDLLFDPFFYKSISGEILGTYKEAWMG